MKPIGVLATAMDCLLLASTAADAAAKKKRKTVQVERPAVATTKHPHDVYFHDGDLIGRDPIRSSG